MIYQYGVEVPVDRVTIFRLFTSGDITSCLPTNTVWSEWMLAWYDDFNDAAHLDVLRVFSGPSDPHMAVPNKYFCGNIENLGDAWINHSIMRLPPAVCQRFSSTTHQHGAVAIAIPLVNFIFPALLRRNRQHDFFAEIYFLKDFTLHIFTKAFLK